MEEELEWKASLEENKKEKVSKQRSRDNYELRLIGHIRHNKFVKSGLTVMEVALQTSRQQFAVRS